MRIPRLFLCLYLVQVAQVCFKMNGLVLFELTLRCTDKGLPFLKIDFVRSTGYTSGGTVWQNETLVRLTADAGCAPEFQSFSGKR